MTKGPGEDSRRFSKVRRYNYRLVRSVEWEVGRLKTRVNPGAKVVEAVTSVLFQSDSKGGDTHRTEGPGPGVPDGVWEWVGRDVSTPGSVGGPTLHHACPNPAPVLSQHTLVGGTT